MKPKMRRTLLVSFGIGTALTCVFSSNVVRGASPNSLSEIERQLNRKTQVPVMLPNRLPKPAQVKRSKRVSRLHPSVSEAGADRYSVNLELLPDCDGATACNWGSIRGRQLGRQAPPLKSEIQYKGMTPKRKCANTQQRSIELAGGKRGYFFPSVLFASCTDSKIVWDSNGHRYTVGVKGGSFQQVKALANRVIRNSSGRR